MSSPPVSIPAPDTHRPRGTVGRSRRGKLRAWVLVAVHVAVLVHVAHWKITGTTLTPVEPSEARETIELGYVNAGFVLLVVAIAATLVFGRFFCGWACHVVAYQDAAAWVLGMLGLRPRAVRSRLLLLVPVLAAIDMFVLPLVARFGGGHARASVVAAFTTDDLWETFPGPWIAGLTFVVDGFLLVWFLGAKGFCTNACPYGALFAFSDRAAAPGRVRVTDACEGCGHCTAVCTSNVRVHEEVARHGKVVDPGCMRCLDCVSVCPKDALYFGFRGGAAKESARSEPPSNRWDFTWGQELALFTLALAGIFAFRGLYHAVPFMLALGLGVLFAVAVVVLALLLRRREVVFQHWTLRVDGRWTSAGRVALLLSVAFVAFTVHSGVVHASARLGTLSLHEAEQRAARRTDALERAQQHLDRAHRLGLFADPELTYQRGVLALATGDFEAARARLRRAIDARPADTRARLSLAETLLAERAWAAAADELDALLERDPDDVEARYRRAQAAIGLGSFDEARTHLEAVLERAPAHPAAQRDLARVRAVLGG